MATDNKQLENRWYNLRDVKPEAGTTIWGYLYSNTHARKRLSVTEERSGLVFTDDKGTRFREVDLKQWKPII